MYAKWYRGLKKKKGFKKTLDDGIPEQNRTREVLLGSQITSWPATKGGVPRHDLPLRPRITVLDRPRDILPDDHLPTIIAANTVPILRHGRTGMGRRGSALTNAPSVLTGLDPRSQAECHIELTPLPAMAVRRGGRVTDSGSIIDRRSL